MLNYTVTVLGRVKWLSYIFKKGHKYCIRYEYEEKILLSIVLNRCSRQLHWEGQNIGGLGSLLFRHHDVSLG